MEDIDDDEVGILNESVKEDGEDDAALAGEGEGDGEGSIAPDQKDGEPSSGFRRQLHPSRAEASDGASKTAEPTLRREGAILS